MDRFSEQMIVKQTSSKDTLIRILIIAGALVIFAGLIFIFMLFGTGVLLPVMAAAAGDIWLAKWLTENTFLEYEYIVTNDDLDIDKIIGRKKRKRMVTVKLSKVTELAQYDPNGVISSDVTVLAHDETGEDMWYVISETEKYGKLAVIFNPDGRTLKNMINGFSAGIKVKYLPIVKEIEETEEAEEDDEISSETEQ